MTQDKEVVSQIADRLKFFFSAPNLRSDRYLQKELLQEDDFGGSISAEKLLNFKSIRQHTAEVKIVIEAAKTLPNFLLVSDDSKISCKEPLKKSQLDDNIPLSLHVSNLPVKDGKYAVGVNDLKPIFEKYGTVTLIRLKWKPESSNAENKKGDQRKGRKMIPAASCSIEFEKVEELEKAVEVLIQKPSIEKSEIEIKGEKVKITRLCDWIDARKNKKGGREKGSTDDVQSKSSDLRENIDEKRKRAESTLESESIQFTIDWKPGCVIELKGLDAKNCDREAIRAIANIENNLLYADYSRGQSEGAIRFSEPSDEIQKLAEKLNSGEIKIAESIIGSAHVLAGEEEQAYWKKFIDFKTKNLQHQRQENSKKKRKFNRK